MTQIMICFTKLSELSISIHCHSFSTWAESIRFPYHFRYFLFSSTMFICVFIYSNLFITNVFQHMLFLSGLRGAIAFALSIENTLITSRQMMLTGKQSFKRKFSTPKFRLPCLLSRLSSEGRKGGKPTAYRPGRMAEGWLVW